MKTKILTLLIAAFMVSSSLLAQKNVVKIKPLRPISNVITGSPIVLPLAYERVIIPRLSAQLNFQYQLKGQLDPFGPLNFADLGIATPEISSWGIGPEVRFYPNITKETPRGFYLQGFLNFNRTSISSDFNFNQDLDFNGVVIPYSSTLEATGYFNRTSYGLGIGSQWLVADRISIDILWFGAGWGSGNIGLDLEGPLVDLTSINAELASVGAPPVTAADAGVPTWTSVAENFEDDLGGFDIPVIEPELTTTTTTNSANLDLKMNIPTLRLMNFTIGFAF